APLARGGAAPARRRRLPPRRAGIGGIAARRLATSARRPRGRALPRARRRAALRRRRLGGVRRRRRQRAPRRPPLARLLRRRGRVGARARRGRDDRRGALDRDRDRRRGPRRAGAAERLGSGGVMVVHDYGLVEPTAPLADYEHPPRSLPSFVELVVEPGAPRSFFRLFGDERAKVVQITTDVSFPELAAALAGAGTTIVLPHGNNLLQSRSPRGDDLREGDGVFLSELGLLRPGGDLAALLARLEREQEELRRRYAAEHLGGRASMYADLLFAKR